MNKNLQSLAKRHNIFIGAAVKANLLETEKKYQSLIKNQFNMVTPENEMKWHAIRSKKSDFDFTSADKIVSFATNNALAIRGHTLVWGNFLPQWLIEESFNVNSAEELLKDHIQTVVDHFKGKIYAWDVVNEAIRGDGHWYETLWLKYIGREYIKKSFLWAHEADPKAKLFYNEWGIEIKCPKSDAVYCLISELLKQSVPIHGIGIQMHIGLGRSELAQTIPSKEALYENMKRFAALGLETHITEMDVQIQNENGTIEDLFKKQAQVYADVLSTALSIPTFKAFVTWGVTDKDSWIPGYTGHEDTPLLFDRTYKKKPAYYAVEHVLSHKG